MCKRIFLIRALTNEVAKGQYNLLDMQHIAFSMEYQDFMYLISSFWALTILIKKDMFLFASQF